MADGDLVASLVRATVTNGEAMMKHTRALPSLIRL
jgi:hypothetical protein